MTEANGGAATPLKKAKLGILVVGDMAHTFARAPEYWVIDCAIAAQNMLLAAKDMGIGSVWLGTWPQEEKTEAQKRLFDLPDGIVPHSLLAFGFPAEEEKDIPKRSVFEAEKVHYEKW